MTVIIIGHYHVPMENFAKPSMRAVVCGRHSCSEGKAARSADRLAVQDGAQTTS